MNYDDIRDMPTNRNNEHESLYRSFHVLAKVKELLAQYTDPDIVLELIVMMETPRHGLIDKGIIAGEYPLDLQPYIVDGTKKLQL